MMYLLYSDGKFTRTNALQPRHHYFGQCLQNRSGIRRSYVNNKSNTTLGPKVYCQLALFVTRRSVDLLGWVFLVVYSIRFARCQGLSCF